MNKKSRNNEIKWLHRKCILSFKEDILFLNAVFFQYLKEVDIPDRVVKIFGGKRKIFVVAKNISMTQSCVSILDFDLE